VDAELFVNERSPKPFPNCSVNTNTSFVATGVGVFTATGIPFLVRVGASPANKSVTVKVIESQAVPATVTVSVSPA
jgi:hypothetical protein